MNRLLCSMLFLVLLFWVVPLQAQQLVQDFENVKPPDNWFNLHIHTDSTAFSGNSYALIQPTQEFGPGFTLNFNPDTPFPGILFRFSAQIRMEYPEKKAFLVLSFLDSTNKQQYWHAFDLRDSSQEKNQWYAVSDSVAIPADILQQTYLKAYFWNPEKTAIAIDQLILHQQKLLLPEYLPQSVQTTKPIGQPNVLSQNRFYELLFFRENQTLALADNRGRLLTNGWLTHTQLTHKNQQQTQQSSRWKLRRIRQKDDKTYIKLVNKSGLCRTHLEIITEWDNPMVQYKIETRYRKSAELEQQSLVMEFTGQLSQVYRKNRHIDTTDFQKQYYLANEGFRYGTDNLSISLYHPSKLSSIQLDTYNNQAFLNLDAAFDHPMIHYPLMPDTQDVWIDKSKRQIKKGSKLKNSFELHIGYEPEFLPRIMPVPNGYEAALVWTEHADWTNIRTQRAVNFGHENISRPDSATGGFVYYDIPVTKSVFYNNPDQITNTAISDSLFNETHATILGDSDFASLLQQLHERGHEICLHTPEQFTSTRKNLRESLAFMHDNFGSTVWIDHGYNNSEQNNRENWVCNGQLKRNRLKTWQSWTDFGVNMFWNPYQEELSPFTGWSFDGQLHQPYPGFGDAFPDALFHPLHNSFDGWLWTTHGTLEVPEERLWDYYFSNEKLMRLVKYRSAHITHVYPAWVQEKKGFWRFDEQNNIIAEEGFNQALARIDSLRNEGLLLPATVGELILYHSQCSQLDYKPQTDGSIQITHHGSEPIHGLSFITEHKNISITNKTFQSRPSGNEQLFWFDLQPGETVTIQPKL